jgi:predicted esterase
VQVPAPTTTADAPIAELPPRRNDGSYEAAGLRYLEFVTGGAQQGDALPMVVMFHGHGGSPRGFEHRVKGVNVRARFIVPFGLNAASNGGFEWFQKGSGAHGKHRELAAELPRVTRRVAAGLGAIVKLWPTVGRMIAMGHSQGAELSFGMAIHEPEVFAYVFPVSGRLPMESFHNIAQRNPRSRPEIHAFQGDADPTIDVRDARNTIEAFKRAGFKADIRIYHGEGHEVESAWPDVLTSIARAVRKVTREGSDDQPQ